MLMHYLIPAFSFYNNRTTIAMFYGLVQIFKFFNKDPEEFLGLEKNLRSLLYLISDHKLI